MSAPPVEPHVDDSEGEVEPAMDDAATTVATISRKARTAEKQAKIEAALKSLPKGSKAYGDIVSGLQGSFRTSRSNREKAKSLLTKEKSRLTLRLSTPGKSKQVKGNEAKLGRVDKLLPLLDSDTNVEENSNSSAPPIDANPYQKYPYYPDFFEPQEGAGCGRHALNNLFHYTYFIKEGAPIVDPSTLHIPISLSSLCAFLASKNTATTATGENTIMCKSNEDYEAEILIAGLNVVGHKAERINDKDIYENGEYKEDTADNVLGYIINSGNVTIEGDSMNHWTALRKVPNEDNQFEFIDSVGGPLDRLLYSSLIDYLSKKYDMTASNSWKAVLRVENHTGYIDPLAKIREIAAAANEQRKQAAVFKAAKQSIKDAVSALGLTDRKLKRKLREARKDVETPEQAKQLALVLTAERIGGKEERIKEIVSTSSASVASQIIELVGTGRTSIATGVPLTTATVPILPPKVSAVPVPTITAPIAVPIVTSTATVIPCPQLYDPCSREPIDTMAALERRVRDIKRQMDDTKVGLYGLINSTTNYEFLTTVFVDPTVSLDDMVSFKLSEGRASAGSDMYEVLSRLFVFFGGIADIGSLSNGTYKFMSKAEGGGTVYDDTKRALESMKCIASKGSGISDITLVRSLAGDKKAAKPNDPYCEVDCDVAAGTDIKKTYVMSVKWYKKEKGAEYYDLEKLYALASEDIKTPERKPIGIIVFLKSKRDFRIADNRSYRQYVKTLGDTFLGWNEDVKPFLEEKRRTIFELAKEKGITPRKALESQYFIKGAKPSLSLQLHQDIIVKGLCDEVERTDNYLFLVGVLPRGGKTYIAGGIIREYLKRNVSIPHLTILWLTAAPNETMSQVKDELLDRFQDFNDFDFINSRESTDTTVATGIAEIEQQYAGKTKSHTVIFCSSQLLIMSQKQGGKRRDFLQNILSGKDRLGLAFFDEAHKTGTGEQTKKELDTLIRTYSDLELPVIFLTATYYNILFEFNIQKQNTFIWDYTDILKMRALATESLEDQEEAIDHLKKRFRESLVTEILERRIGNGDTYSTMAQAYIGFPDLNFISADFTPEALSRFEAQTVYRPDSGFSLNTLFAIKPDTTIGHVKTVDNEVRTDAYKIFVNLDNPRNMISLIAPGGILNEGVVSGTPLTKSGEPGSLEPSLLGRINNLSQETESRFRLDEKPTLLMFMPVGGAGTNIFYLLCAWASLLMAPGSWFKGKYEVACVVEEEAIATGVGEARRPKTPTEIHIINKDPKASIVSLERRLHCEKGKGLIILAGEKLSMGISLPCTDVVFLLNEKKTPDDIIQKMYRALTPSPGKKSAYVVDLNPVRSLAAVYGYARAANENSGDKNTTTTILKIIYDTYTWDADVFEHNLLKGSSAKPLAFQERLRTLFETAERDDTYRIHEDIGGLEKKLGENIRSRMDPGFASTLRGAFSAEKLKETFGKIGLREGANVQLKSGKLVIRTRVEPSEEGEEGEEDMTEIVIDNFIDTVSDFIKYLSITSSKPTLAEAIAEYEGAVVNSEGTSLRSNVLKLVRARTDITGLSDDEDDEDVLLSKILVAAVKNFALSSSEMVFLQMKAKVDEPSTRKDAVLKIIHKHLTPRKTQKEEKGEVFTPIELIESMLSHLPKTVWSDHTLTWLDPANGIGNFPVVAFYKLDEGLKSWEPDTQKRRKHIIEKMLFMLEIQSNNSRIARNIFEKLCDGCKPNILTTNSLEITPVKLKSKGFPESYDIIMGNPPFNAGGILKGGGTLWPKFVRLAMSLVAPKGYIVFVHPPGWRKFYDDEDKENQGKLWYTIRENAWNLDYIHVSDQSPKHFPIVDYYVLHSKKSNKPTQYDSKFMGIIDSGETILDYPFIPNMLNDETMSILKKLFQAKGESIDIVRNQSFQPSKDDAGKPGTPHYHFTDSTGKKHIINKEYSTVPEYINKHKVLLTFSGGYEKGRLFAFYSEDNYGTTGNSMYMLTKSKAQGDKLVKFFNSDIITFLMKITQYSASPNHKNEFKILNQLEVPASLDYGLTAKEQALINRVVDSEETVEETPCPPDKERNPVTRRCTKKCIAPSTYDEKGRCVKPPTAKSKRAPRRKGGGHKTRRARRQIV